MSQIVGRCNFGTQQWQFYPIRTVTVEVQSSPSAFSSGCKISQGKYLFFLVFDDFDLIVSAKPVEAALLELRIADSTATRILGFTF